LFGDQTPHKVRLLAQADGNIQIEHEPLPQVSTSSKQASGRVRISTERTDPADRFLYHKTTHRPLYGSAWKAARDEGFDDLLFLNTGNEVTEGAISNIFIVKNDHWFTPPIECGLLPGVYRRHMFDTRPGIEELPLHLEDLITADAIYITNAVRGLRRVILAR
jgi:para-aminobenzoate synthetase/4-amino-4-deoxychorismate lyase